MGNAEYMGSAQLDIKCSGSRPAAEFQRFSHKETSQKRVRTLQILELIKQDTNSL